MAALPLGDACDRDAVLAAVARDGFALVAPRVPWLSADACAANPWGTVERLTGREPRMAERQPIRPVPGARSFAAGSGDAPLHTDSQPFRGLPPHLQVMACREPAARGGTSLLLDAFASCALLAERDPALFSDLVRTPRRLRFYFGELVRPTLSVAGDELFVTHPPVARDELGARFAKALPSPIRVRVSRGEVLVVDNHRMLHGRAAFRDGARSFVRVLAWLSSPLGDHPRLRALASQELSPRRVDHSASALRVRARFGVEEVARGEAARRLKVVFEMLRGVPPGVLAGREGVAEAELYAWRDAAIAAAAGALVDVDAARDESALKAALDASKQRAARRR